MLRREVFAIKELDCNALAICLRPSSPKIITTTMLEEIRSIQNGIADDYLSKKWEGHFLLVWYLDKRSATISHGLDYMYIYNCLKNNNEKLIEQYIDKIFDVIFLNYINLGLPLINCSLVNRAVNGILKEFFLLNKICFIHKKNEDDLHSFNIYEYKNLVFPMDLYKDNHYFYFNVFKPERMREIIASTDFEFQNDNIPEKKIQFEKIKMETISRLYNVASRDIKVIERLAKYG